MLPSPARRPLLLALVVGVLLLAGLTKAPQRDTSPEAGALLAAAGTDTTAPDWPSVQIDTTDLAGDSNPTVAPPATEESATDQGAQRDTRRGKDRGKKKGKVAYLTFDDGPSDWTPAVLRILSAHDATATFFVLGAQADLRPRMLSRIRRQGSAIGNHTMTHPVLTNLTTKQLRWQLKAAPRSRCFRPPYGATDRRVVRMARSLGMRQVMWTADSRDWELPGRRAIQAKSLLGLRPGAIILMHDGGGDRAQTVDALPGLLTELDRRGYRVRALPGCSR